MPAGVKRHDVGKSSAPGREHRERRNERLEPLQMNDVPGALADFAIDVRRKVIVATGRPGGDPPHDDPCVMLDGRQSLARVRRQDRHLQAERDESAGDLLDMELDAADVRPVSRRDHQDARWSRLQFHARYPACDQPLMSRMLPPITVRAT